MPAALDQANANLAAQQAAFLQAHQEYGRNSTLGEQAVAVWESPSDSDYLDALLLPCH